MTFKVKYHNLSSLDWATKNNQDIGQLKWLISNFSIQPFPPLCKFETFNTLNMQNFENDLNTFVDYISTDSTLLLEAHSPLF